MGVVMNERMDTPLEGLRRGAHGVIMKRTNMHTPLEDLRIVLGVVVAMQHRLHGLLCVSLAGDDAIKGPRESAVGLAAEGHVGRTGLYTRYGWGETWASARVRRAERRD